MKVPSTQFNLVSTRGLGFLFFIVLTGSGCVKLTKAGPGTPVARSESDVKGGGDLGSGAAPQASGGAPSSGSGNGMVSAGDLLRSDPGGVTYGFWRDTRQACRIPNSDNESQVVSGGVAVGKVGSIYDGYFVKFPMVYQARVVFESADCSGSPILSHFNYDDQVQELGVSGKYPSWFGERGFGAPEEMGFFKDLPSYMMASMYDDGQGNLYVNMMSLFQDKSGVLHLSFFGNSRSKEYFEKYGLQPELLGSWPGKEDPKFLNAFKNPLWYMDLVKVDVQGKKK